MALSRDADFIFPALGAGKLGHMENELIQAPEEEGAFDVFNDETFGDAGDADFDWENEHERLAEELEGASFFESSKTGAMELDGNFTRDSAYLTMDRGHPSIAQEDELEQSLTRLVVEDGDSKNFDDNGQPIPGAFRRSHLDELFGPNSPPGYLDLQSLVSHSKNIWGSPSSESPFQKPVNNTLQAMFASAKQAAFRDIPGLLPIYQLSQNARQAQMLPQHAPPLPKEMPTLAEIENSMLARESNKPKVLTAEELERQLRGDPPFPDVRVPPSFSSPVAVPPVGTSVAFRQQPNQVPSGLGLHMVNGESAPINISGPHSKAMHPHESPLQSASPSGFPPGVLPPPGMLAQSPRMMPPLPPAMFMGNRMMGPANMSRPPPPPTHMPPPNIGSPYGSPYGSPSAAVLVSRSQHHHHHQLPQQQFPFHQHHQGRHNSHPYPMDPRSGGGGSYGNGRHDHQGMHRGPGQHGHMHRPGPDGYTPEPAERGAEDEYAGLMTKKEKDWIIKIQLIQLQTDNPYLDDYYFTYHTIKKKAADMSRQEGKLEGKDNELELLIPNMIKIEPRTYTPAQFEGSLGRLTAASVHNPRQIIDVCRTVSPTEEDCGKKNVSRELRRYRQLLMDIEKGFAVILDIDDIEKKVLALPDENRLPLFEERLEKIAVVYDYLMQDDSLKNFVATLQVRKGRKLLARLMPMLGKVQWLSIVTVLLSHLPVLIKRDTEEEGLTVLMPPLSRYLARCDLECLVHFATILQKQPRHNQDGLGMLMHNTFGISLLCCLIKAGEDYFKNTSPVDIDNQLKTQWASFIEEFVDSLALVPTEKLAWPDRHQPTVGEHVDRFVDNLAVGGVEDKLARFSKPRPSEDNTASKTGDKQSL